MTVSSVSMGPGAGSSMEQGGQEGAGEGGQGEEAGDGGVAVICPRGPATRWAACPRTTPPGQDPTMASTRLWASSARPWRALTSTEGGRAALGPLRWPSTPAAWRPPTLATLPRSPTRSTDSTPSTPPSGPSTSRRSGDPCAPRPCLTSGNCLRAWSPHLWPPSSVRLHSLTSTPLFAPAGSTTRATSTLNRLSARKQQPLWIAAPDARSPRLATGCPLFTSHYPSLRSPSAPRTSLSTAPRLLQHCPAALKGALAHKLGRDAPLRSFSPPAVSSNSQAACPEEVPAPHTRTPWIGATMQGPVGEAEAGAAAVGPRPWTDGGAGAPGARRNSNKSRRAIRTCTLLQNCNDNFRVKPTWMEVIAWLHFYPRNVPTKAINFSSSMNAICARAALPPEAPGKTSAEGAGGVVDPSISELFSIWGHILGLLCV